MIKVLRHVERPAYERLLLTARAARMPVVGHVVPEVGLAYTLAMGQASLEHAEPYLFGGARADFDAGAAKIARAGAWVGTIISARDGACGPPTAEQRRIVAALRGAGVRLLAGSDAGIGPVPHGEGLHCELATLVAAGMRPVEALQAATRDAGAFAREQLREAVPFGTVTMGARADLLLLAADPREDIGALRRPVGTVVRGAWRPR
jgi:imidazolonepropionase-like amidohydrolase